MPKAGASGRATKGKPSRVPAGKKKEALGLRSLDGSFANAAAHDDHDSDDGEESELSDPPNDDAPSSRERTAGSSVLPPSPPRRNRPRINYQESSDRERDDLNVDYDELDMKKTETQAPKRKPWTQPRKPTAEEETKAEIRKALQFLAQSTTRTYGDAELSMLAADHLLLLDAGKDSWPEPGSALLRAVRSIIKSKPWDPWSRVNDATGRRLSDESALPEVSNQESATEAATRLRELDELRTARKKGLLDTLVFKHRVSPSPRPAIRAQQETTKPSDTAVPAADTPSKASPIASIATEPKPKRKGVERGELEPPTKRARSEDIDNSKVSAIMGSHHRHSLTSSAGEGAFLPGLQEFMETRSPWCTAPVLQFVVPVVPTDTAPPLGYSFVLPSPPSAANNSSTLRPSPLSRRPGRLAKNPTNSSVRQIPSRSSSPVDMQQVRAASIELPTPPQSPDRLGDAEHSQVAPPADSGPRLSTSASSDPGEGELLSEDIKPALAKEPIAEESIRRRIRRDREKITNRRTEGLKRLQESWPQCRELKAVAVIVGQQITVPITFTVEHAPDFFPKIDLLELEGWVTGVAGSLPFDLENNSKKVKFYFESPNLSPMARYLAHLLDHYNAIVAKKRLVKIVEEGRTLEDTAYDLFYPVPSGKVPSQDLERFFESSSDADATTSRESSESADDTPSSQSFEEIVRRDRYLAIADRRTRRQLRLSATWKLEKVAT